METYMFIALIFIYSLTVLLLPAYIQRRIWTLAYIISFIITAVAIGFIKIYAGETLMKVGELNWYYILYVFGSISIIFALVFSLIASISSCLRGISRSGTRSR